MFSKEFNEEEGIEGIEREGEGREGEKIFELLSLINGEIFTTLISFIFSLFFLQI